MRPFGLVWRANGDSLPPPERLYRRPYSPSGREIAPVARSRFRSPLRPTSLSDCSSFTDPLCVLHADLASFGSGRQFSPPCRRRSRSTLPTSCPTPASIERAGPLHPNVASSSTFHALSPL